MKIVQTPVRFYPYVGGVENYVYELSKELIKLDNEVLVLCANEGQPKDESDVDGIKVKGIQYSFKIANTNIMPRLPFTLRKVDFDLMHTHLPTPYSADVSALISKFKEKPAVLTYHNEIVAEGLNRVFSGVYNRFILPLLLRNVEAIVVTTDRYKEKLASKCPFCEDKISVIPVGVDVKRFKPIENRMEKNRKRLLFLSVLDDYHRYKGLDHLLEAVKGMDVELTVGGSGDLLEEYRKKAGKNVVFLGHVKEEEKVKLYNDCDIFVLPSTSGLQEGFGMVALEALSCGVPVIISNVGGIADKVKKHGCGTVVEPGNVEELRKAIKNFDPEKGRNARKCALEHSWKRVAYEMSRLYESLV